MASPETSLLIGVHVAEPAPSAGRSHRMCKLGSRIGDDEQGLGGDHNFPL